MNDHDLYKKALSLLTSQGKFHIKLGLERISELLGLFNNPQDSLKVIHIAGTNGKGSTCAMLASILTEAGYKTGLYTSPHLVHYTERMKINGSDISDDDFAELVFKVIETADRANVQVTEFEILTAAVFIYFKRENVDVAVIETGLGGRLDATNIIKNPLVSVITSIDLDHIDRLGKTIAEIAFEKSGIIKNNQPIVTLTDNNGIEIIKNIAKENNSPLFLADSSKYSLSSDLKIKSEDDEFEVPLLGLWQLKNLSLVLKTIEVLNLNIPENFIKSGLKKTVWQGRLQYLKEKNLILDGAHNPSAAKLLKESLDFYFPNKDRIWIYSSITTKDYESVMCILFRNGDTVILTKSSMVCSVDPHLLKENLLHINLDCRIILSENIKDSINLYNSMKSNNNIGILAGSLYSVGEALTVV